MSTRVDALVPAMSHVLDDRLSGPQQKTQASLVALESTSTAVLRQEEQLSRQVAELVPAMSLVLGDRLAGLETAIQARLVDLETKMLAAPRNYSASGGHTHTAMAAGTLQKPSNQMVNAPRIRGQRSSLLGPPCSCPAYASGTKHRDACPWAFLGRTEHSLRGNFKMFNYLVRFKVVVGYSRRSFLRDLGIYPSFTMRATCPWNAPAFELLGNIKTNLQAPDLRMELRSVLIRLRSLFMEGKAWPTDVNEYGESLFMVLTTPTNLLSRTVTGICF